MRRLSFAVLFAMAFVISACGRQVTPDPGYAVGGTGLPSGFMSVTFCVSGQMDFSKYNYMIVFNTTGNGTTPLPLGANNSFAGYSFAIIVSGASGSVKATAWQYYRPPGTSDAQPTLQPLITNGSQLRFTQNTNGSASEFTVMFDRSIAFGIAPAGRARSKALAATASPTGSPSPTASRTALPSGFSTTWLMNMFVTNSAPPGSGANLVPSDSLGSGGPTDVTYLSPSYDTTSTFNVPVTAHYGSATSGGDPNGEIAQSEIANQP